MSWRDLIDRPDWMQSANCRGMNPDVFFPERGEATREIKALCRECDVQAECLAYAMNTGETHGIWGGLSGRERRATRRRILVGAS
jgi:WhiB family redox-sensing transcriptional regulator